MVPLVLKVNRVKTVFMVYKVLVVSLEPQE
jgi:hypothetical protein